jgi:dipeptidyl aminopeptidase/acylaminoacyl peptidase
MARDNDRFPNQSRSTFIFFLFQVIGGAFAVSCFSQMSQPAYLLLVKEQTQQFSEIHLAHPDGSQITKLFEFPVTTLLWLSPDGTKLATWLGQTLTIFDVSTRASLVEIEAVGNTLSEHFVQKVAWSPASDRLIFIRLSAEGQGTDLWLYDLKAQSEKQLTHDEAINVEPTWSPDGEEIAFLVHAICGSSAWACSPDQQYWDIIIMNADGSDRRTITDYRARELLPPGNHWFNLLCNLTWSPDKAFIAFENACGQSGLRWGKRVFIVATDNHDVVELTPFSRIPPGATEFPESLFTFSMDWSLSENRLLLGFTESELKPEGLKKDAFIIFAEEQFHSPAMPLQTGVVGSTGNWSPDRQHVIWNTTSVVGFSLDRPAIGQLINSQVSILDLQLPYGSCFSTTAKWSPDGKHVAYASHKESVNCPLKASHQQVHGIVVVSLLDMQITTIMESSQGNKTPIGWISLGTRRD